MSLNAAPRPLPTQCILGLKFQHLELGGLLAIIGRTAADVSLSSANIGLLTEPVACISATIDAS